MQKIGVHKCTDDDMLKFYPPGKKSRKKIEAMKEKQGFNCLDSVDEKGEQINMRLFGSNDAMDNRSLGIIM